MLGFPCGALPLLSSICRPIEDLRAPAETAPIDPCTLLRYASTHAPTGSRVPSRARSHCCVGSSFACPPPLDVRTRAFPFRLLPAPAFSSLCALHTRNGASTTSAIPWLNHETISNMEGSYVPQEVLGLAIFVDCLSLVATILGLLLCFMLWNHGERVSCKLPTLILLQHP